MTELSTTYNQANAGTLAWQTGKHESVAFTGDTDDSHGDTDSGTPTPTYTLWTVTGDIIIRNFWGVVNTTLTDAADGAVLEVGVVGNTALLMAQIAAATAGATLLEDGDIWHDAVSEPAAGSLLSSAAVLETFYINDGANIIETTTGANIQTGQIDYYCIWAPAEPGASIVSAGTLS